MIYLMLIIWLGLIFITGRGLYRLWSRFLGGAVVDWLMLPATLISELFYSAGRLLTGRPVFAGIIAPQKISTDPCRTAISGKYGFLVELLSVAMSIVACVTCFLLIAYFLSGNTITHLYLQECLSFYKTLPQSLPNSWDDFWAMMTYQTNLLDRFGDVLAWKDFHDWQTWAFIYGSAIFAVRIGPVRHDLRATLCVGAIIVGILAAVGAISSKVGDYIANDMWYIMTYLWAILLMLLFLTMIITGIAELVVIFINKGQGTGKALAAEE